MKKILEDKIKKAIDKALKETLMSPLNLYSEDFMDIEKRKYARNIIRESAHAFEGQYTIAQECAEEVISNIQQNINTTPSYYKKIISIMRESNDNSVYYFCRGLYLSYFHETQAFISQAWAETEKELNKYPPLYGDKEMFIDAFNSTNVANDFLTVSFWCKRIANDAKLCEYISKALSGYGMHMTSKEVFKNANNIVRKLENAVRKALNNAYINWQNSIKKTISI